ncbi:MAG: hypothetical protein P8P74_01540 [Crocinitomicaceae bacterium]|nr:hypothetical protein [Crocinitomicaceae bacterium]
MLNNELQELLSARFEGHTHSTDEAVWSAIEAELDAGQSDRAGIWFWIFNGLAATVLFGLMFQSGNRSTVSTESSGVQLSEIIQKETTSGEMNETNEIQANSNLENTESDADNFNSASSTEINDGTFQNSILPSTQTSQEKIIEPTVEPANLVVPQGNLEESMVIPTNEAPSYRDSDVDELPLKFLSSPKGSIITQKLNPTLKFDGVNRLRSRLPIHVGAEFTYLQRNRVAADAIATPGDSSYASSNDRLAYNRHFEFSLFSQFDFTMRFSASIGFGYSRTKFSFYDDTTTFVTTANPPMESMLKFFTIPLQTKFKLIQKNRFGLSTGLTFQSDFGSITHNELAQSGSSSTSGASMFEVNQSEATTKNTLNIRQFAFEPFVQFSLNFTPRISSFANFGYRMYVNQADKKVAPIGRLNYFNADIGLLFRLR